MNIALVGPGLMSIPPNGWGSVETLMWKHTVELRKRGHNVQLFNSRNLNFVAEQINNNHFDFVHCHYDAYAGPLCDKLTKPLCVTSHWPYLTEEIEWRRNASWWNEIFEGMLRCKGFIGVSHIIVDVMKNKGFKNFTDVLINGIDVSEFSFNTMGIRHAICLGAIHPRKMQAELAAVAKDKVAIDFVGHIEQAEKNFKPNSTCNYLGSWNRNEVTQNLTKYKCLVLLSNGEAAPLVAPEALAAGLSLLLTETAAANVDRSLPFIQIIPNDWHTQKIDVPCIINQLAEDNQSLRSDIRNYAKDKFDMPSVIDNYEKIIDKFKNFCR